MTHSKRKMPPLQFYKVAINGLGAGIVKNTLRVKHIRTLQRWTADPLTTSPESQSASHLELHRNLFEKMDQVGLGYACRGVIRYLESALGDNCSPDHITGPADTMVEEKLLDFEKLSELHTALSPGAQIERIKELELAVIEEIQRTVAKHIKDNGVDDE